MILLQEKRCHSLGLAKEARQSICVTEKLKLQEAQALKENEFKNLESIIQSKGQCTREVKTRMQGDDCQG